MESGAHTGKTQKILFYCLWLSLNLIQSSFTGLLDDEAYYWVYSKFLDWGYFDHPPMISLLIKFGYAIFPNELGVRLLVAILSTATLWLVQNLLTAKDDKLFYSIAVSIAVLQLGGIIAVPDVPLLFFTALFFHAYKRFLSSAAILNCFYLAMSIALLLYSKYHGLLVVLLTIASNPKLVLNKRAYLVTLFAIILFLPHLYWQYAHNFPSFQYHLKERVESSYRISFTLDYIFQQLLFAGPLSTIVLFWAVFRRKPIDLLERALKFTTIGFYTFFLVFSFRGNIEANWTFPAFIGLIVLSHQYLRVRIHLRKLVNTLAILTLCFVVLGRAYMAGVLPPMKLKGDEFLFNREWTNSVKKNANGLPVFFIDSYQRASKYWFYSGTPTYSLNTLDYRRNNFNFWKMEDSLQHKKMYGIYQGKHFNYFPDSIQTPKGLFLGRNFDNYFSFSRILFTCNEKLECKKDDTLTITLNYKADEASLARIHPAFDSACIWMAVYKKDVDEPIILPTDLSLKEITVPQQQLIARVGLPIPQGNYTVRFGITSCINNWPTINSSVTDMKIK